MCFLVSMKVTMTGKVKLREHVCICVSIYVHVRGARGHLLSSLIALHLIF